MAGGFDKHGSELEDNGVGYVALFAVFVMSSRSCWLHSKSMQSLPI